ncbi:SGNH/GDSL hydrolase family protein [Actinomadura sp. ATCC 31491]|uniref:SGNH/GDSL hydrolase family protein n=1 Tax=Actinomadura luzonensis TaxID=2805427 RepID=A0ABT0FJ70_9ACTN|nr:SGNH/GDSL hydrolase family protein [Actinomadura luzonensis]MCK2212350.1 SGNH/GDSL hydrolase family protein [Actinomadura luzonensis]
MTTLYAEESDPLCLPVQNAAWLAHAPWRRFAAMGDSLAAGTHGPSRGYADLGWCDRLAGLLRRVRPDLAYLNTAAVGATVAGTLDGQLGRIAEFGPDLLHVSCGANDLWRREPDLAATERDLRRLFAGAAATGALLTTFTLGRAFVVPRFPDWSDRVRALNDVIRALAAEHDAVLADMWDHPVNDRPGLLSADGVHFSAEGQAVMAAELVRGLARRKDRDER